MGRGEEGDPISVFQSELTADDERHLARLGRFMGANDSGQRAFVRNRQGRVPEFLGSRHQLTRMRGTMLEAEVG
jgi:hypothetical protein